MKIENGLFNRMILQRDKNNESDACFDGTSPTDGEIFFTAKKNDKVVKGFKNKKCGEVKRGKLKGVIKGLKVGGTYDIELTLIPSANGREKKKLIKDILVGDVWILAGQSNMQGVGLVKDTPKAISEVRAYYMDYRWAPAREPIHNMWVAKDRIHAIAKGGTLPPKDLTIGAGPGVAFGQGMFELSGIPQGLVPCARGGTSMDQWDPKLKNEGDKSFYGAMYKRFLKQGSKVAGVIWYQGCNDTGEIACQKYAGKMKKFIRACRKEFKNSELPFVMVQIGRVINAKRYSDGWTKVRNEQYKLADTFRKNFAVVTAVDLELEDVIHISGKDHNILGKRLAYAANRIINDKNTGKPEMRLKKIKILKNSINDKTAVLELTIDNVDGELTSNGRPLGFILKRGEDESLIYRSDLKKNKIYLSTTILPHEVKNKCDIYYGKGLDPVCNILDCSRRALPAFGPVRVK